MGYSSQSDAECKSDRQLHFYHCLTFCSIDTFIAMFVHFMFMATFFHLHLLAHKVVTYLWTEVHTRFKAILNFFYLYLLAQERVTYLWADVHTQFEEIYNFFHLHLLAQEVIAYLWTMSILGLKIFKISFIFTFMPRKGSHIFERMSIPLFEGISTNFFPCLLAQEVIAYLAKNFCWTGFLL